MRWLIDTDIFIEGERGDPAFDAWRRSRLADEFATVDAVRGEFLLGVYAVTHESVRARGEQFYQSHIRPVASLRHAPEDFEIAARLVGEARRLGRGRPSLVDGLLAAVAQRTQAVVATQNLTDFRAMGCPCANPLQPQAQASP